MISDAWCLVPGTYGEDFSIDGRDYFALVEAL